MNSFLGILVLDTLDNHKTYSIAIREILHYLHLHQSVLKIIQTPYLLTIYSLHNTNSFSIPKQGSYAHTCHHRITFNQVPAESEISYFRIVLECLLILKEYFPSKVQIQLVTENQHLQTRLDIELKQGTDDLARRYISHFRSLLLKAQQITLQQAIDVLYILRSQDSQKLIGLGLSILKKAPANLYLQINQLEMRTLQQLAEQQQYEKSVEFIIERISQARRSREERLQQSRKSTLSTKTKYDQPVLLNSFTFQLRESNNIERLGFLIEKITTQVFKLDKQNLNKMDKAILQTVERLIESNKIVNSQETLAFVDNLLRYLIIKKQVNHWDSIIELLLQCLNHPLVSEGIRATLEVFYQEFKDRTNQKVPNQLILLMSRFEKGSRCETDKQNRQKPRVQENCRTSRNSIAAKSRKHVRSMHAQ